MAFSGRLLFPDGVQRAPFLSARWQTVSCRMGVQMDSVVHFEMPYEKQERMATFYQSVFDWQLQILGADMDHYVVATTAPSDTHGQVRPGAINGGFFPKVPGSSMHYPAVVIAVDNLQSAMQKVTAAGGTILGEPMQIPGVGQYIAFVDTEANRVSMLQPLPRHPV